MRAAPRGAPLPGPALAALLLLSPACRQLPTVGANQCGNAVVEAGEDCDSFAPPGPGFVCRPRDSPGECRLDCRARTDGSRPSCPVGWGCDSEGICRQPTARFERLVEHKLGGVATLLAGDFDGDGRADVLGRGPLDAAGQSKMSFHYFDERGGLAAARPFPKLVGSPVISPLSDDGRSDLVFTNKLQMGMLLGRSDRTWVPEAFGQFRAEGEVLRVVPILDQDIEGITPILAITTYRVPGLFVPEPQTGFLSLRGPLPPLETLIDTPVSGDIIDDSATSPCRELIYAVRGASHFTMVDSCARGSAGEVLWRARVLEQEVHLVPGAPIDAGPLVADVDGDGHLDVLIGAGGRRPYLARGDGRALAPAVPFRIQRGNPGSDLPPQLFEQPPMPLAVGDLSGDGSADYVFANGLLLSTPTPGQALPSYFPGPSDPAFSWTEARIADLNGNGKPDLVAASSQRLDIDFFNGTASPRLSVFQIPTNGPVKQLAVEDLDGDLIMDLAFVESATSPRDSDTVMLSFGAPAGPPLAPTPIARVGRVAQVMGLRDGGLAQLALVSSEAGAPRSTDILAFFNTSGDRIPFAPYLLSSFTSDGSVQGFAALGLASGAFSAAGRRDVMAMSTSDLTKWLFWLIPQVVLPSSQPRRINAALDPRLQPASGNSDNNLRIDVVAGAADLDGDQRDESLWLMPADDFKRCGLQVLAGAPPEGPSPLPPLFLDHPCLNPQMVPVDADQDGRVDLALLTGASGQPGRKILLLWNEGSYFSSATLSVASAPQHSPEAFTALPAAGPRGFGLAYVSGDQVLFAGLGPAAGVPARSFSAPETLGEVARGTGIVAADVNGDGVSDLVVAGSGYLGVMKAELESR